MPVVRFGALLATVLCAGTFFWAWMLQDGWLGGYFLSLPLVPLFFFVQGVGSLMILYRIIRRRTPKLSAFFSATILGRLLIDTIFLVLGLWLLPNHRVAFVILALYCYLASMILSIRSLTQIAKSI